MALSNITGQVGTSNLTGTTTEGMVISTPNSSTPRSIEIKAGNNTDGGNGAALSLSGGTTTGMGVTGPVIIQTPLSCLDDADMNSNTINNVAPGAGTQAVNANQLNSVAPIGTLQTAYVGGIGFATLNVGPVTLLAANATRSIKIVDCYLNVTTSVSGASLAVGSGATTAITYNAVGLSAGVGSSYGSTNVTPGAAYNAAVNNTAITIGTPGTLLTGVVDALLVYIFTS